MAEVEHVTGTGAVFAERLQYLGHFAAYLIRLRKQDARIQIALQCHAIADLGTCCTKIDGPV